MKIYKSKYGWSTTAHSTTVNGDKVECYFDCQFKKGFEPENEIEGELYFKAKDGTLRSCFLSSYAKHDGTVKPKLVLKEPEVGTQMFERKEVQVPLTGTNQTVDGHLDPEVKIDPDELPFIESLVLGEH